jgi:hypothetical protein
MTYKGLRLRSGYSPGNGTKFALSGTGYEFAGSGYE